MNSSFAQRFQIEKKKINKTKKGKVVLVNTVVACWEAMKTPYLFFSGLLMYTWRVHPQLAQYRLVIWDLLLVHTNICCNLFSNNCTPSSFFLDHLIPSHTWRYLITWYFLASNRSLLFLLVRGCVAFPVSHLVGTRCSHKWWYIDCPYVSPAHISILFLLAQVIVIPFWWWKKYPMNIYPEMSRVLSSIWWIF